MAKTYKVAVLPGDGIGKEVIPEAVRVMEEAASLIGGLRVEPERFSVGAEYYVDKGQEWSIEAEEFTKNEADAILFGAVGTSDVTGEPIRLLDGRHAGHSIVIGLRQELDLYANHRPAKLYEGVPTPLADKNHNDIDMVIIRENTEGLYAPIRGALKRGAETEVAVDSRLITKSGSSRVIRYAFDLARKRDGSPLDGRSRVTCVDKSNMLAGCNLFRSMFKEVAEDYQDIETDFAYVDAWTLWALTKPEFYDVLVAPNMFGDIISDLAGALQGGLGMAPSGNIGNKRAMFEPVHGSAPDIAGQNKANPIASILSVAMMYDWLGSKRKDKRCKEASLFIENAVQEVLKNASIRTPDICRGMWKDVEPSTTGDVTDAVVQAMAKIDANR
ncbi:MAG: isocitrate/isopropylmalate dehydrogenase family protein [Candidatus Thorarchaeota archaeon]|nr:isocitrate/isopropylmalate dehydrogenase family protein [Candidatus Thorarchaeota archaeon]